jgi:hypothetical protein
MVKEYKTKNSEKLKKLPDITPRVRNELLAIEETTIR